jgi:hypothetical protein
MRLLIAAVALLTAIALGSVATGPRTASACSLVSLTAQYLPGLVERTPVVAIGTWTDSEERTATLVVDEGLKGAADGDEFVVDNRQTDTQLACSPYEEAFRIGHRFHDGQRSVVFLEKEVNGLWQVGWSSRAAFALPVDDMAPLSGFVEHSPPRLLEAVRDTISAVESGQPDSALETELGCGPPHLFDVRRVGDYTTLARSVALVTVVGSPTRERGSPTVAVTAATDEVLNGEELPTSFKLNDYWISDYETNDCEPQPEDARRQLIEGQQYLVFLRADEFGVADYRPVAWGKAIVSVNDRWLTFEQPTLALVRSLTGAPAQEGTSATADNSANTEGRVGSMALVLGGVTAAIAALGAVVLARRRWMRSG